MAALTDAELTDRVEEILEDGSNAIFTAASISSQLQDDLKTVSFYKPWEIRQTLFARDGSRELSLSTIDNLIDIDEVEYPIDRDPRAFRSFEENHQMLIMDIRAKPSATIQQKDILLTTGTENQVLTGTVTFTANSTAVTGSGTAFSTELQVGYYISPTSLTAWYRVASITDDTNLVLAEVVKTNDGGADTGTYYWFRPVYLYCNKNHYVEKTQTDLAGAIDLVAGYAKDSWMVHVDALGTGTMPRDMLFTIAGVDGVYRITDDATIGSSEADIFFDPPLKGVAADNSVVTFYASSLDKELESVLPDYTAAKVALNWVGDTRTTQDNVRTILDTTNTELDKVGARLTNAVAHITSGAGEITDKRAAAITELDLANQMIDDSETDLDAATSLINTVTIGDNPVGKRINSAMARLSNSRAEINLARGYLVPHSTGLAYSNLAARELQAANGYISEGTSYINEAMARLRTSTLQLTHLQNWANRKLEATLQTLRRMSSPKQKTYGYSRD
ncbi:hypothetical protein LCGC14_0430830 [marine sediment metagenome]|uniref:Uncharacterized protein n=1 Tax=marine sediment metagenome TaxID=412755 RepID=A0A0F9VXG7_9ZZZZ